MLWVLLGVIVLVVAVRLLVEAVGACAGLAMFVLRRGFAFTHPGTAEAGTARRTVRLDEPDEEGGSDEHPPFPDDR